MKKVSDNKPCKKIEQIKIYIWGKYVGAAAFDSVNAYYAFAYDKNFGKSGIELSPIHMPLRDNEEPYIFSDLPDATYKRLPALLADALPDDFGNALIDSYMASKGILKSKITALDRLGYMGSRSMGALEFKPARGPTARRPSAIEMNELVTEARKAVQGSLKNSTSARGALRSIIDVGTSAGGARAKAVIAWNPKTKKIYSGQFDAPKGFEHWLLKFDGMGADRELGSSQDYGRIEYAYYLMARAAGIQISHSRLLEENNRAHFMTKRFDREKGNIKHHTQTLCAINHIDYKKKSANSYEQFFMTIQQLSLGHDAHVEGFRRMVFNIMGRNCDDHSKNFSFLLKQGGSWELAPAYDITFAHNPEGEWTKQHLMSVNNKFKNFKIQDFQEIADRFNVGEAKHIIEEVRIAIRKWPEFAKMAGLRKQETERIKKLHLLFQ